MKFGLLRFTPGGCSIVALRSLPPLEVVNLPFMSMFSYINITLPNAHKKMNLLYD
jgi:hypothetical protein